MDGLSAPPPTYWTECWLSCPCLTFADFAASASGGIRSYVRQNSARFVSKTRVNPNIGSCLAVKLRVRSRHEAWRSLRHTCAPHRGSVLEHLRPKCEAVNIEHESPMMCGLWMGLVCTFVDPFTEEQRREPVGLRNTHTNQDRQTLIISNLIDGTFKAIPPSPLGSGLIVGDINLDLFVESISNSHEIFLLNPKTKSRPSTDPWLCVYESLTNQWRKMPDPAVKWNGWGMRARTCL
ncbi:unnamed protein product [Calypogeia fissa]